MGRRLLATASPIPTVMAFKMPQLLWVCTFFVALARTAIVPAKVALTQPSGLPTLSQIRPNMPSGSVISNNSLASDHNAFRFPIPETQTTIIFTDWSGLLSSSEMDLCIIEGINKLFKSVLAEGKDSYLPLRRVEYRYGNVAIEIHDFSTPAYRMTYSGVVATLRGLALFASQHGYYGSTFDVYDGKQGHVGTGELRPIIPDPPSELESARRAS